MQTAPAALQWQPPCASKRKSGSRPTCGAAASRARTPCWCGAATATPGAIYIKVSRLDGTAALYGPAPAGLDAAREERRWQPCLKGERATESDADAYLERQIEFDPDIWIVAVEDRQGRHFLDDWLAPV